jgi:hypothetical protein
MQGSHAPVRQRRAFPFPVIRVGVQNPEVSSVLAAAAREEPSAARVKAP